MGEAKRRGTKDERVEQAILRQRRGIPVVRSEFSQRKMLKRFEQLSREVKN